MARGWAVTLDKTLPVAAGLGGGSADAGAIFRMVERSHGLPDDWAARAGQLGADVPACVASRCCIGLGTGTELQALDNDIAGMAVLLVNPRVPLSTGPVFAAWDGEDRGGLPAGSVREIALAGRNDLEAPAIFLCPPIADVLVALADTRPLLARMSGSGATCFALYDSVAARDESAAAIAARHPGWWSLAGVPAVMVADAFRIVGTPRFGGILIVADHASNRVPGDIDLGMDPALLETHVAWDIGVAGVALRMVERPGIAAFMGNISRLVCDYNREGDSPAVVPESSDGHVIPGNRNGTQGHRDRLSRYFAPYHEALAALLDNKPPALILSLHSFTPALASKPV